MTLRDYLKILHERRLLVLATVAIVTLSSLLFSLRQPPQFTTGTRIHVQPIGQGSEVARLLDQLLGGLRTTMQTEAELVRSTAVAKRVVDRLELAQEPETLLDSIKVDLVPFTEVMVVNATASTPAFAATLADAFAEEYIASRRDQAIEHATQIAQNITGRIEEERKRLASIDAQLAEAEEEGTEATLLLRDREQVTGRISTLQAQRLALLDRDPLANGGGQIIERAPVPLGAANPNHIRTALLGMFISIPLAIGLTLLRDSLSDTVKTKEEAESLTGAPALALVPFDPALEAEGATPVACRDDPASMVAEAYRTLRVNLEFSTDGERARYAMITSAGPAEGKSLTAANLALAFAEAGRRTVLVSADLRRPRLHSLLDVDPHPGLSEALLGVVRDSSWIHEAGPHLWFAPSGSAAFSPSIRFDRKHLEGLFGRIPAPRTRARAAGRRAQATNGRGNGNGNGAANGRARTTDMVIIDTPPILRAAEVPALAASVDGVVLVVRLGVTRRFAAARAAEQARKVGGRILGIVIIGVPPEDAYDRADVVRERAVQMASKAWGRVLETIRR